MNRYSHSDSWEDPPEDDTVPLDPMDDGDYAYDTWKDKQMEAEIEDRDCDYWNNLK